MKMGNPNAILKTEFNSSRAIFSRPDGNSLALPRHILLILIILPTSLLRTRLPLQTTLLGWRTNGDTTTRSRDRPALIQTWGDDAATSSGVCWVTARGRGGVVADGIDVRDDAADIAGIDTVAFAGFVEGVVAAVKVFALVVAGEDGGLGGKFAVETEEALFLRREGLYRKGGNVSLFCFFPSFFSLGERQTGQPRREGGTGSSGRCGLDVWKHGGEERKG